MTAPTGPTSPGVKRVLIPPMPKSNSSSTLRPPGLAADWIDRPSGLDDLVTTSRQLPDSWARENQRVHGPESKVRMDGQGVSSEGRASGPEVRSLA